MTAGDPYAPLAGAILDGKVKLVSLLGEGGMGAVYRGIQLNLEREVAVKLLKPRYFDSPDLVRRFYREARSAGQLRSRHVIGIIDYGQAPEGAYIVMELSDGVPLIDLLQRQGPLSPPRVTTIGAQILSGLAEAHAKGIIHRDLKSENILVERDYAGKDFALVLDFGIAKLDTTTNSVQTAIGSIFGTPAYMSPEQCRGIETDARTDLYSLGIILFEMLTGEPPFQKRNQAEVLVAHISEKPPDIMTRVPGLPPALGHLVMSLLEKDRERRPQSAELARRAILQALGDNSSALAAFNQALDTTLLEGTPPRRGSVREKPMVVDDDLPSFDAVASPPPRSRATPMPQGAPAAAAQTPAVPEMREAINLVITALEVPLGPAAGAIVDRAVSGLAPSIAQLRPDQLSLLVERLALLIHDANRRKGFLKAIRQSLGDAGFVTTRS